MSVAELKQVAISKIEGIDDEKALQEIIVHLDILETNNASQSTHSSLDDFFQQMKLKYSTTLTKLAQ